MNIFLFSFVYFTNANCAAKMTRQALEIAELHNDGKYARGNRDSSTETLFSMVWFIKIISLAKNVISHFQTIKRSKDFFQ